jgi:hypothetical protein
MSGQIAPHGARLDLSGLEIVDNHCHGLVVEQVLASEPASFETRLTILAQAYLTSNGQDPDTWRSIESMVEDNVYSIVVRRMLAGFLGSAEEPAALARARDDALRADPVGYLRRLLDDAGVSALVADEGYTYQPVAGADLAALVGRPVHRVARIESFIDQCTRDASFDDFDTFADAVEARLEEAAADPATIALKSIVAYRTGLDIGEPDLATARDGFQRWRRSGFHDERVHAKAVRDALVHRAMAVVERHGIALHIHCGDGDADVVFQHSRPQDLYPFLTRHRRRPIVLMHAGHPWSEEAAYLASILPHVFVDLSVLVPWTSVNIPSYLTSMLGMAPSRKLLYSSDQVYEPELFWIPALLARRGLERSLAGLVDSGDLTAAQATAIAAGILAGNCRRLHGI